MAGCLFEVRLPRSPGAPHWRWLQPPVGYGAVTLLAEHPGDEPADACRLRFRAESPGRLSLRFAADGEAAVGLEVSIAAENIPL